MSMLDSEGKKNKMIDKILKQLKPKVRGKIIYLSQYGSHLYGLNTENSDLDFRGVYIPTLDDIILKKDKDEINEELWINANKVDFPTSDLSYKVNYKKGDVKIFSLQKFITLCSKADTNALDLLFSVNNSYIEQYGSVGGILYLLENRDKLINTDRLESPITYAFKQATKYSIKGERRQVMMNLLKDVNTYLFLDTTPANVSLSKFMTDFIYQDGTPVINHYIEGKHVKIDILDNKGKEEKYLYVCGVQHQFNL